jgi:hypothetical protein
VQSETRFLYGSISVIYRNKNIKVAMRDRIN